jgi:putative glutamine amidotransferase
MCRFLSGRQPFVANRLLVVALTAASLAGSAGLIAPAWADDRRPAGGNSAAELAADSTIGSAAAAGKPLIGINLDVEADSLGKKPRSYAILSNYVEAVRQAGGLPLLLPPMSEADFKVVASRLDGLLMIGGDDYPPETYGDKLETKTVVMEDERAKFDLMAARLAQKMSLPYLGICAGSQVLNIACGGTLIQDIPSRFPQSKVSHASKNGWQTGFNKHTVKLEGGSKLASILGDSLTVVTSHHQCVGKPGADLKVAARSEDGLVEAVEAPDKPFCIGVQWHPERDFSANKALFKSFVAAACAYGTGKSNHSALH